MYLTAQHITRNVVKHPCQDYATDPQEADHLFYYNHEEGKFVLTTRMESLSNEERGIVLVDSKANTIPMGDNPITSWVDVVCANTIPIPMGVVEQDFQTLLDARAFTEHTPGITYTDIEPERGEQWGYTVRVPWRVEAKSDLVAFQICCKEPHFWFEEGPRLLKLLLEWRDSPDA